MVGLTGEMFLLELYWYGLNDVSSSIPTGWAPCNGRQELSRTTYSDLFAVLGTSWGSGDGSTTFNLPDTRNHYIMGDASGSVGDGPICTSNLSPFSPQ